MISFFTVEISSGSLLKPKNRNLKKVVDLEVWKVDVLSGSLSNKSGPLDFGTKNNFPSFFVSEKGLANLYKKVLFSNFLFLLCYEPKLHFGQTEVADRDQKGKIPRFLKRATSPKIHLGKFRFHTNSKAHSLLWLTKYGNFSENSKLTREAGRHPTLRPSFTY